MGRLRLLLGLALLGLTAAHVAAADAPPITRVPPSRTVAQLGTPTMPRLYGVTDGADATDCTVGGGSTFVLCFWDGSAWTAVGSGGGGGGGDFGANSLTVDAGGGGQYSTIGAAIAATSALTCAFETPCHIYVAPALYDEEFPLVVPTYVNVSSRSFVSGLYGSVIITDSTLPASGEWVNLLAQGSSLNGAVIYDSAFAGMADGQTILRIGRATVSNSSVIVAGDPTTPTTVVTAESGEATINNLTINPLPSVDGSNLTALSVAAGARIVSRGLRIDGSLGGDVIGVGVDWGSTLAFGAIDSCVIIGATTGVTVTGSKDLLIGCDPGAVTGDATKLVYLGAAAVATAATLLDADNDATPEVSANGAAVLIDADDDGAADVTIASSSITIGSAMSGTTGDGLFGGGGNLYLTNSGPDGWRLRFLSNIIRARTTYGPEMQMDAGAAGYPTYSWNGDNDTGVYRASAGVVGISGNSIPTLAVGPGYAQIFPTSTPPVTCDGTTEGATYYDSDLHLLCTCNGTNWLQQDDWSTTCS